MIGTAAITLSKVQSEINVQVRELLLTPLSCASIVTEIIKCLLYQKNQIPCPYNCLQTLVCKKQNEAHSTKPINLTAQQHFRVVSNAYNIVEDIVKNIQSEFKNCSEGIKQVLVVFGSTVYTPKEAYHIRIENLAHGHLEENHALSNSKRQHKIIRDIIFSKEWIKAMDAVIPLTNMYVLIQKHCNVNELNDENFFQPNLQYSIPTGTNGIVINLEYLDKKKNCCKNLTVFEDDPEELKDDIGKKLLVNQVGNDFDNVWFQVKIPLKGFKNCYINKVSATELW